MQNRMIAEEFIDFAVNIKKYVRIQLQCEGTSSLTEQQFRALMYLKRLGRCTLKELSESIHTSNSSMCIMLNKLWNQRLIIRENDEKDRRNTFYSLSSEGNKLLEEVLEKKLCLLEMKIDRLSEDKKETLVKSMKELKGILELIK